MRGEEQEVNKAAKEVGAGINDQVSKYSDKILDSIIKKGASPKEALGFTNQKMDAIYGQAYRLYNTGKYKEALELFRVLVILDPTESKYTLGVAACLHMMKEYMAAAKIYLFAGMLDPQNPVPHFHASDCYIQMRDKPSALICLEMAVKIAGNKPEYQVLKDRASMTIEGLKKDLLAK